MPIATPEQYAEMLDRAKAEGFAYPAFNVSSSQTLNAVLQGLTEAGSDGIIQVTTGGADYFAGHTVKARATGALAFAKFATEVAKSYPVTVALHTDHCPKPALEDFVMPLIAASEEEVKAGRNPIFQSHMWDGSAVPLDENIQIAEDMIKRTKAINAILEVEIGVVGGGAWGTAIAQMLTREGQDVLIWCRETDVAEAINTAHENTVFLPGVALKPALKATNDLADLAGMDAVFAVAPAQHTRATLQALKGTLKPGTPVVLCSKGIELATGEFMTQVLKDELPDAVPAVMSGPSFAIDVAQGLPTAVTFAIEDEKLGTELIAAISTPTFRPYLAHDLLGAEIGGAVKNVLAIACGIVAGKELGDNARAALITRGLAEMSRLVLARGGKAETLMGLAGLGDLTLTCTATQSRNYSFGVALGRGESVAAATAASRGVVEGRFSAAATLALARDRQVEMPICTAVDAVVNAGADLESTIAALLARPFKAEGFSA